MRRIARLSVAGSFAVGSVVFAGGGLVDGMSAPKDGSTGDTTSAGGGLISFGDPIPGLTAEQLALFEAGKVFFDEVQEDDMGLGPVFNKDSCVGCHSLPVSGGAGTIVVTRFARFVGKGEFDPMAEYGGSLGQGSAINEDCLEDIDFIFDQVGVPEESRIVINRLTPPMFGSGLIEAIPDETILALADPDDADGDGISGKAHIVFDAWEQTERVGRFGWKAQVATLDTFSADAGLNELGITNILFGEENDPNGILPASLDDCDMVADPEDVPDDDGVSKFNLIAAFQRFLAPPQRLPLLNARGFVRFRQIGCADCHTPIMFTGDHEIAALSNKPVFLFSDLLLHDMGTLGDEIEDGDATGTEMRTAPLWGLRERPNLLHDGRAGAIP